ncbi:MAG: patatin-like phospholipase family protein [Clostridia bacterium]|nr:patatin-like phospholipase family protein [Clostridia bacterium]
MKAVRKKDCCLVLEGGGVKCAYQYGVLKTLVKVFGSVEEALFALTGGEIRGVAGSSFGAVNSAMLLAGGMDKLEEFWETLSAEKIFHEPRLQRIMEKIYARQKVFDLSTALFALSSGLDPLATQRKISKLYFDFLIGNIDEKAVRSSGLELGITTVELADFEIRSDKIQQMLPFDIDENDVSLIPNYTKLARKRLLELFLKDIDKGMLPEYVAASAAFPAFRPLKVGAKFYTDGGILDNIPVSMMEKRGFRKALVIRTGTGEPKKRWTDDINVRFITPSRELGAAAIFSVKNIQETIALGEYDAEEAIKASDKLLPGGTK